MHFLEKSTPGRDFAAKRGLSLRVVKKSIWRDRLCQVLQVESGARGVLKAELGARGVLQAELGARGVLQAELGANVCGRHPRGGTGGPAVRRWPPNPSF
jgi:hypothetical protein